ncbi:MAG: cytochrome P450 [Anaerolineaceae bacterium]|nr:cytochrome P450 [Anaerolineaceae bacterium]
MTSLTSIEQNLNPFPIYKKLREQQPVFYDSERFSWNIFNYSDVERVLSDYEVFSSEFHRNPQAATNYPLAASIISTDPPRHRQLRALATQAFTPRSVDALAPRIQAIVDEYLDKVMPLGRMDVIQDLGYPLPTIVIAELLGIPTEDRQKFKIWSDWIVQNTANTEEINPEIMHTNHVLEMSTYFIEMIQRRQDHPGEDLISRLMQASIDQERLSMSELLGFCTLLLIAGNETTTNLIGNALLSFCEHPQLWQRLRQNPELAPQAIEEVLRYRSPVQAMFRYNKSDIQLDGQTIPAGSRLIAWIGSANHDETQFEAPEEFDIDRNPNKHIAFGHGVHYCLGAPLARLEARIALNEMLKRFSKLTQAAYPVPKRLPSLIVYGLDSLPITFTN